MGIEGEQLVFDYLSRVGDLAHGTPMTAAERARLVSGLRAEIDRLRAAEGGDPGRAAVRRILGRLGTPEEQVAGVTGGEVRGPGAGPAGPGAPEERPRTRVPRLPQMRRAERPAEPPPSTGASPPHLAGMDELSSRESDPDWWRVDPGPYGGHRPGRPGGDLVPGFVGGIEVPDVLRPPPSTAEAPGRTTGAAPAPTGESPPAVEKAAGGVRPVLGALLRRGGGAPGGPAAGGVVELGAAALLVAGAVLGSLVPLGLGWLAAWWSPRLSRSEAKWAVLGMPALCAAATGVWLWGRQDRRWGTPIAGGDEAVRQVLAEAGPVVLRVAAVASALFLLWRARRRPAR